MLTENKEIEFCHGKQSQWGYLDIRISINRKVDHAGFYLYIEFFGYYIDFSIYDIRHWCNHFNKFKDYSNCKSDCNECPHEEYRGIYD